jgi:hypothetical protein
VAERVARCIWVWDPRGLRVTPLILRAMTSGRITRSAALLSGGHARLTHAGEQLALEVPQPPGERPAGVVAPRDELRAQRRHLVPPLGRLLLPLGRGLGSRGAGGGGVHPLREGLDGRGPGAHLQVLSR